MHEQNPDRHMARILEAMGNALTHTDLPLGGKRTGKVRDQYRLDDQRLLFVTTDRQSAFDRILAAVPYKGAVLNLVSAWWFDRTKHIVENHLISVPDPQASVVRACTPFPIEFVVRGYITGSTDTSLWTHYQQGERIYCGNILPNGLTKNQKLEANIITPTTKEEVHDRPISAEEIVSEGWMTEEDWHQASQAALALFAFGQAEAATHGLILVDTKYEMGKDENGNLVLIDEIHTPDSSRYWLAETYGQRIAQGLEPENIDKEFLRLWFRSVCDPYHDAVLPEAPTELVAQLSSRYIQLYEMITGTDFPFPSGDDSRTPASDRLLQNLRSAGILEQA